VENQALSPTTRRSEPLLEGRRRVSLKAAFVAERIDISGFRGDDRLGISPLVVTHADGLLVLFRYGVVVMIGISSLEQVAVLRRVRELATAPFDNPENEELSLRIEQELTDRAEGAEIHLQELTVERVQLIADALAKSVVLAHHEQAVEKVFDRIEPLADAFERGRVATRGGRALLAHIGSVLRVQTQMVARVGVADKPELLWERPDLELFYARLVDEFELSERHTALERKLELISQTAETLLDVLQHRHTLRVEWYIVLLIVAEIMLTLYGMFWHS
jgi:uncharacterized Rmd1/YagE family protein